MPAEKTLLQHILDDTFRSYSHGRRLVEPLPAKPPVDATRPALAENWDRLLVLQEEYRNETIEARLSAIALEFQHVIKKIAEQRREASNLFEFVTSVVGPHPRSMAPRATGGGARFVRFAAAFGVHIKGSWAGKPVIFERWQLPPIRDAYRVHPETGLRVNSEVYEQTAKKTGKSLKAALVELYGLCGDDEWGAEVYGAATDKDQARIVFNQAAAMAERSRLRPFIRILKNEIVAPSVDGVLKIIAADAISDEGINLSTGVIDEYHHHESSIVYDLFARSGEARDQPLVYVITNAGADLDSPCGQLYLKSKKVKLREPDARKDLAVYIPEIPEDIELRHIFGDKETEANPELMKLANPSSWITVPRLLQARERMRPADFVRFRLNRWTRVDLDWLPEGAWASCVGETALEDAPEVVVAVDWASKRDTVGIVVGGWVGERIHLRARSLAVERPSDGSEPRVAHEYVDEQEVPYARAESAVLDAREQYRLREMTFDPFQFRRSAEVMRDQHGIETVEFPQSNERMVAASKDLFDSIVSNEIMVDDDPIFSRHIADCSTFDTGRGWRLVKAPRRARGQSRIRVLPAVDLAIAAAMCVNRLKDAEPAVVPQVIWLGQTR